MNTLVEKLEIADLCVDSFDEVIATHRRLVSGVSFVLRAGEALGITGESGSGKTTLSLALGGLLPPASRVLARDFMLRCRGRVDSVPFTLDLSGQDARLGSRLRRLRGRHFFTLFQEPRASLNPYRTIGWQLARCMKHPGRSLVRRPDQVLVVPDQPGTPEDVEKVLAVPATENTTPDQALTEVGLDPDVSGYYPHELSTGMCQRVFLAMAHILGSSVLIADEPFASLDTETQHRMTLLLRDWLKSRGILLILVSHNLELLRELAHQSMVMYRGQVAEIGPTRAVLGTGTPAHPYTRLLRQISQGAGEYAFARHDIGGPAAPCCFAARCIYSDSQRCVEEIPEWRQMALESELPRQAMVQASGRAPKEPGNARPGGGPQGAEPPRYSASPHDGDKVDSPHQLRCVRYPDFGAKSEPLLIDDPVEIAGRGARPELLRARGVVKDFTTGWIVRRRRRVLDGVNFSVSEGERVGILGPSGQGKTTLARLVLGVLRASEGSVELAEQQRWVEVGQAKHQDLAQLRMRIQMLYQDTDLVLDPATRIGEALIEAYQVFDPCMERAAAYRLGARLIEELSLPGAILEAYPHRLSGGERKRVALARSLAALGCPFPASPGNPFRLLLLDEPTAGIDVFLQAGIARFLLWVQRELRLSFLVISHDESFVRGFCHRSLQMRDGQVEEIRLQADGGSAGAVER